MPRLLTMGLELIMHENVRYLGTIDFIIFLILLSFCLFLLDCSQKIYVFSGEEDPRNNKSTESDLT